MDFDNYDDEKRMNSGQVSGMELALYDTLYEGAGRLQKTIDRGHARLERTRNNLQRSVMDVAKLALHGMEAEALLHFEKRQVQEYEHAQKMQSAVARSGYKMQQQTRKMTAEEVKARSGQFAAAINGAVGQMGTYGSAAAEAARGQRGEFGRPTSAQIAECRGVFADNRGSNGETHAYASLKNAPAGLVQRAAALKK
jgi:hypothetical protein